MAKINGNSFLSPFMLSLVLLMKGWARIMMIHRYSPSVRKTDKAEILVLGWVPNLICNNFFFFLRFVDTHYISTSSLLSVIPRFGTEGTTDQKLAAETSQQSSCSLFGASQNHTKIWKHLRCGGPEFHLRWNPPLSIIFFCFSNCFMAEMTHLQCYKFRMLKGIKKIK